jgi:hypothetical protein
VMIRRLPTLTEPKAVSAAGHRSSTWTARAPGQLVDRVGQAWAIVGRLAVKLGPGVVRREEFPGTDETTAAHECGPSVMSIRASVSRWRRIDSAAGRPGPGGIADTAASARTSSSGRAHGQAAGSLTQSRLLECCRATSWHPYMSLAAK